MLTSGILNASWSRWKIFSITKLLNCSAAENEADTGQETRRYFLFAPYLSNPRDLDFFKRNICICCSPPFYFSLFALGATSLRDQMTCRIFHFLLLGQDNLYESCVSKYVRQELLHDKHSVIQSNPRLTIVCRAEWKYERLSYWISQNSVKSSCWS